MSHARFISEGRGANQVGMGQGSCTFSHQEQLIQALGSERLLISRSTARKLTQVSTSRALFGISICTVNFGALNSSIVSPYCSCKFSTNSVKKRSKKAQYYIIFHNQERIIRTQKYVEVHDGLNQPHSRCICFAHCPWFVSFSQSSMAGTYMQYRFNLYIVHY